MKIEAVGIYDRGDLTKERLHLRALADIELNAYLVLDTNYVTATTIQVGQRQCYWLPPKSVKAGESVIVYTRVGSPSTETQEDGTIHHFIFRQNDRTLYHDKKSCAVTFELAGRIECPNSEVMKVLFDLEKAVAAAEQEARKSPTP
jgi:hypothetical protein